MAATPPDVDSDLEAVLYMQQWLYKMLVAQLIHQKLIQPWDGAERFGSVLENTIQPPSARNGFELARKYFWDNFVQGVDPRSYDQRG